MTETQNEYREESGAGNHYRTAYHQGLEALLARLQKQSDGLRKQLHKMLLERPEAFRRQIRQSLGWPLTEKREDVPTVKREYVASDKTTDIYRMQMEIQPGLWMYGILFLRRSEEALPLVISQHGGFGTPELCSSFFDSANYHDMTRRILRRGVHVFCPQLFMWHAELFGNRPYDRRAFDDRLKRVGSSITAIEIDGLQKYLDYFQTAPQIQPDRIGMIGLSYGGFYTMLLTALDTRIRAAMSACFFNTAQAHDEFSDCFWANSQNCFQDAELAALVYPRRLWIDAADGDELFPCNMAQAELERLKAIRADGWDGLRFRIFKGIHEFPIDDAGIEYVVQALK